MSWGTRRRNTVIFIVIIFLLIPVVFGAFSFFYEKPTCFDGKINGGEAGVDCGGPCELLCTNETLEPIVVWERFFRVEEGLYNVVAYVENQNANAGVKTARYNFELFNEEGVLIANKKGVARLYPKSVIPIIESGLRTGKQIPTRVSFEFETSLIFEKEEPINPVLIIKDENYFEDPDVPGISKVKAEIENISLESVFNVKFVVMIYDVFNNVIATSSTFVDRIDGEESREIVFTWPTTFREEISRIEIVPVYDRGI